MPVWEGSNPHGPFVALVSSAYHNASPQLEMALPLPDGSITESNDAPKKSGNCLHHWQPALTCFAEETILTLWTGIEARPHSLHPAMPKGLVCSKMASQSQQPSLLQVSGLRRYGGTPYYVPLRDLPTSQTTFRRPDSGTFESYDQSSLHHYALKKVLTELLHDHPV